MNLKRTLRRIALTTTLASTLFAGAAHADFSELSKRDSVRIENIKEASPKNYSRFLDLLNITRKRLEDISSDLNDIYSFKPSSFKLFNGREYNKTPLTFFYIPVKLSYNVGVLDAFVIRDLGILRSSYGLELNELQRAVFNLREEMIRLMLVNARNFLNQCKILGSLKIEELFNEDEKYPDTKFKLIIESAILSLERIAKQNDVDGKTARSLISQFQELLKE